MTPQRVVVLGMEFAQARVRVFLVLWYCIVVVNMVLKEKGKRSVGALVPGRSSIEGAWRRDWWLQAPDVAVNTSTAAGMSGALSIGAKRGGKVV
jgi:hypothetical protein